jgi:23S rRNA pseudouridine2605 synthase
MRTMSRRPVEGSTGSASKDVATDDGVRLQKVLALAGFGSRRHCEELIEAGRVLVNGRPARLGLRVDPERDVVRVDGATVPTASGRVYLAVHKPPGMLSAMSDARGRPCVGDLVREQGTGLHHVGRLDADSEGLLLVTNDGVLSHRLSHPSYGVPKRYLAAIEAASVRGLTRGPARADRATVVDRAAGQTLVELEIHEGRNRIVRRMFESLGYPVQRLVRTAIGPIRLGELRPGRVRHLNAAEVRALYASVDKPMNQ